MIVVDDLAARLADLGTPLIAELFRSVDDAATAIVALGAASGGEVISIDLVRASAGLVVGLRCVTRTVVVKVHRPHLSGRVIAASRAQRVMLAAGLPVAAPLLDRPISLGRGMATVDEWRVEGAMLDVRSPQRRRAIAAASWAISAALPPEVFPDLAPTRTGRYPPPHSALFDFDATWFGAQWIDDAADEAREIGSGLRAAGVGELMVLHADLRPENLLLVDSVDGTAAVTTIYDLDSLECDLEPWLIGGVARAFSTNWSQSDPMLPTVHEIGAFIKDYETYRRCPFTEDERLLAASGVTYALAYSARCEHALFPDGRDAPWGPGWRDLLRRWSQQPDGMSHVLS